MSVKFGRIQALVEELETVELINDEDSLMLQGGKDNDSSSSSGNNCKCNGNNCNCNTTFTCQP